MARVSMERLIDLPPSIVWDALVDPVLVEGWLHPELRLVEGSDVLRIEEPETLAVDSEQLGRLTLTLVERDGGPRGSSTALTLELDDETRTPFLTERIAAWRTRLDQLQDLLHGHPVDWDHWERDRRRDYEAHLEAVRAATLRQ